MPSLNIERKLANLRTEFNKSYKCIFNKRRLKSTIDRHIKILISCYNKIVRIFSKHENIFTIQTKTKVINLISTLKQKLTIIVTQQKLDINITKEIKEISTDEINIKSEYGNIRHIEEIDSSDSEEEAKEIEEDIILGSRSDLKNNMALSKIEFLKICSSTLNKNYSGDPLALQAFLNSIDLLDSLADTAELKAFLLTVIKTKLEGKALEAVPNEITSVENLKTCLKNKLKPDSSKVVEGKMLALRLTKTNVQEFAREAELLSDAFRRALVFEGIPYENSQKMTTEKTVAMCKLSARSESVRTILAAATFSDPKDVIAKLVVETNDDQEHKQILHYRKITRGSYRGRYNYSSNYRNSNNYHNNGGNNSGYRNNYGNNNRGRQNNSNSRNSASRGNYTPRGNYNNSRGNRGRNNNNGTNPAVRVAENLTAPQQDDLGEDIRYH